MSELHSLPFGPRTPSTAVLEPLREPVGAAGHRLIALVGPPNSGKTTLFNRLTGLRQKVANYPGVTVDYHVGQMTLNSKILDIVDLPGVYSLTPRSEDEQVTHNILHGQTDGMRKPDAVLLILDATNLSRHLMLAAPILAMGLPTLILLNMADELQRRGGDVDTEALANQLGAPVARISAAKGEGLETIRGFLAGTVALPRPVELPILQNVPACRQWAGSMSRAAGYQSPSAPIWTKRLDALFLHPIAGPLVFLVVMLLVFQSIFVLAQPLMDGVETLISSSGELVRGLLPNVWLQSLVVDGVWSGVGSVVVFLPQILILFAFIGILEDSGYLARAAVISDRTMTRVGLQGKSFIPLLSAYACAIPAIMATRTIESKRDRLATILIAPFMTCSARLPVYTLIIAAFLPERDVLGKFLGIRALTLMGLYLLGFLAAVATAWVLQSSVLKAKRQPFVMELPPYRWPTLRSIGLRLLDRSKVFLRRAGTVILAVSIGLWALASLPLVDGHAPPIEDSLAGTLGRTVEPVIKPLGFDWRIGIGLITSLAAREVIIGTLGTIYGIEGGDESNVGLQEALRQNLDLPGAIALLVFFAFAMQCLSTLVVVRRETGGWKYPAYQFGYMTTLAFVSAFFANHLTRFLMG